MKEESEKNDVKQPHTVPRFLLDNFGFRRNKKKKNNRKQLYTFDKHNGSVFIQSVFDATTRNAFYKTDGKTEEIDIEPFLTAIENTAAPAIKKIVKNKDLNCLSKEEIESIAIFVIVQKSRTYHGLQVIRGMLDSFRAKMESMGHNPEQIIPEMNQGNDIAIKNLFLSLIFGHMKHAPLILEKSWLLYETTESCPFYISDNPVSLHNDIDMGPYGNLGLAVKGIQIHLPISSTLTLAFTCPSIEERTFKLKCNMEMLLKSNPYAHLLLENPGNVVEHHEAYRNGTPMTVNSENVRFLNSLQVIFSEQYLFCRNNNFSLVREMISNDEKYRVGLRPKFN